MRGRGDRLLWGHLWSGPDAWSHGAHTPSPWPPINGQQARQDVVNFTVFHVNDGTPRQGRGGERASRVTVGDGMWPEPCP